MGCQLVRIMFLRGRQIGCTSAKVMSNPACGSPGPDSWAPLSGKNSSGGDRRSYRWSQRRILEEIRPNPIFRGHSLTVLGQNKWSSLLKFKSRYWATMYRLHLVASRSLRVGLGPTGSGSSIWGWVGLQHSKVNTYLSQLWCFTFQGWSSRYRLIWFPQKFDWDSIRASLARIWTVGAEQV